jgi:hypothetical protein
VQVTKEQVETAFKKRGFTIEERFEECGFLYFKDWTGSEARLFWTVHEHVYPDTEQGRLDKQLDERLGTLQDRVEVRPSWGMPSEREVQDALQALKLYVGYVRQIRGKKQPTVFDQRPEEVLSE